MEKCNQDDNGVSNGGSKDCLRASLGGSTKDAMEAEFKKEAEKKLGDLVGNVGKSEQEYRDTYSSFSDKWQKLTESIFRLKEHFEECYDYECFIREVICKKVVCKEWELRKNLLEDKLCGRYKALYIANEKLGESRSQLDAWEKITTWFKNNLETNEKLYDEICKLDNCQDRYFAIYILYFQLCPAHDAMGPPSKDPIIDPAKKYCGDTCCEVPENSTEKFCGFPRLINPDDYNCKLDEAWRIWKKIGLIQVAAQCEVDEIEKCIKQYEEIATSEFRRNSAREAFQRFDSSCCKKGPSDSDESPKSSYTSN